MYQEAIPQIIEKTKADFFTNIKGILKEAADLCYDSVNDITCMSCAKKPGAAMSAMVKLDLLLLEGINDDIEFCMKLAQEESVLVFPGVAVGMKTGFALLLQSHIRLSKKGLKEQKPFANSMPRIIN
ncbi:hypothetical protein SLEP1_g6696 [Rubroshorea leprosula]|uniref:Uncharacterized protein n=1 Tax=Rubroshorea leprosula TaxID=152421 RepID=A0AAV5HWD4_9ROSI|nr:hypothetical protein SLEP1_g6696 [Rubroshorea leprosula]